MRFPPLVHGPDSRQMKLKIAGRIGTRNFYPYGHKKPLATQNPLYRKGQIQTLFMKQAIQRQMFRCTAFPTSLSFVDDTPRKYTS